MMLSPLVAGVVMGIGSELRPVVGKLFDRGWSWLLDSARLLRASRRIRRCLRRLN